MKFQILIPGLFAIFCLFFVSCGGDDDVDCDNENELITFFNAAINPLNTAIMAFSATPNEDTCNDLVDAYEKFIDDLEPFQSCADEFGRGAEWRQDIEDARASLAQIDCTF